MGLRDDILALEAKHTDNRALADELGALDHRFGQMVAWWGPRLYARDPVVFLPLIERWLSPWQLRSASGLDEWMAAADANRDFGLWRTIYQAKLNLERRGAAKRWASDLLMAFSKAPDRAARRDELDKRDLWYDIDDELAASLYAIDPVLTGELLLGRIERADWWSIAYEKTAELALERGDEDLHFELYRATFGVDRWAADVVQLAATVADPAELCRELGRRHLAGEGARPKTLLALLEARGGDVVPYLERHISDVSGWGNQDDWKALARAARQGGWTHLWALIVRSKYPPNLFDGEVWRLCAVSEGPAPERAARLLDIAGARWGWGAWRRPTVLSEKVAVKLYDSFALICRTAFAPHLYVSERTPYLELAKRAAAAGDTELVDRLAARAAQVRVWKPESLAWYAEHYAALDDETFAGRAVEVLGLIAPPAVHLGRAELRRNPVFNALFADSGRYAPALDRVRDLLEAPYEPARRMAMRILTDAGSRAIDHAVRNADHLGAYLLDEASRATRIAAFDALAVAAEHSREIAGDILGRARAALDLRRKRYPRDRLIELIGRILARWPELRRPAERPVIFEAEAR